MTRAEAKTIKSFMSRTTDRFRPPYGRMPIQVERQNVFAGTTNENEYLKDATGGRRFWPIRCTAIDLAALNRDKDQLWAEAVAIYIGKLSKWWIDEVAEPELAVAARGEADARYQRDAWEDIISDWVIKNDDGKTIGWLVDEDDKSIMYRVTKMAHLFEYALGIPDKTKWTHTDQRRIGTIMKRLGWERKQVRVGVGNDRQRVYRQKR